MPNELKPFSVKPLVWTLGGSAKSACGAYYIIPIDGEFGVSLNAMTVINQHLGRFVLEHLAKAAAQADYERRILSAIESAPINFAAFKAGAEAMRERIAKWHEGEASQCDAIAKVNLDNALGNDCITHAADHRLNADDIRLIPIPAQQMAKGDSNAE